MRARKRGGCTFAEAPSRPAGTTSVFWCANINPAVLSVDACPVSADDPGAFDICRFDCPVTLLRMGDGNEHVLLGDGARRIQLEVRGRSLLEGSVRLRYDLAGFHHVEAKLATLQRLLALWRLGRFPRSLFPPERRAHRWIIALRALDGRRAGATSREIAAALFSHDVARNDWDGASDYLRSRVRRAIATGEDLARDGYLDLLNRSG
jgi:hypothetical protein